MFFGIRDPKSSKSSVWGHDDLLMPGACGAYMRNLNLAIYWGTRTSVMPFSDMLKSLMS